MIRAGAHVDASADPIHRPLQEAARHGDAASTKLLFAAGADPHACERERERDGNTFFHVAAARSPELLALLPVHARPWPISRIDQANRDGRTPLTIAVWMGHLDALDALIGAGSDPDSAMDANGDTALTWAAQHGKTESLVRLIALGSDVRHRNLAMLSPLEMAVLIDNPDAARALMDAGVDPREAPDGCRAPTYWAEDAPHKLAAMEIHERARTRDERDALAAHAGAAAHPRPVRPPSL